MGVKPEDLERLNVPASPDDLEWKVDKLVDTEAGVELTVFPYLDARAVMDRLNEVCGKTYWQTEFKNTTGGVICRLSIFIEGQGWVHKEDGASFTGLEPVKGGCSDALKRASTHWGFGRYLYDLPSRIAFVHEYGRFCYVHDQPKEKKKFYYFNPPALPTAALPEGEMTHDDLRAFIRSHFREVENELIVVGKQRQSIEVGSLAKDKRLGELIAMDYYFARDVAKGISQLVGVPMIPVESRVLPPSVPVS